MQEHKRFPTAFFDEFKFTVLFNFVAHDAFAPVFENTLLVFLYDQAKITLNKIMPQINALIYWILPQKNQLIQQICL